MIRRWLVFLLLLLSASLTSAAREALSFISYEKATDVASDSFNVYCGTDKGLIIYRGAEGSFQYSGDPGDLLEGHHIYMIAAAEELGEVLAFTDRGIFRRLADDSWEKIGGPAG
ncbi:MAG TPA: hypothetical protein PLF44_08135, partial [Candidatus Mcinerneyibacteriales bacterium]|nr:hypothetical protein [Candidatus Mcinerneyibacteriales bacterium]